MTERALHGVGWERGDRSPRCYLSARSVKKQFPISSFDTTPAKSTYRAIYRVGDAQVGLWSNPVSITVGE